MPQRIQTPIAGITTTSAYEEGSCYSLVNLRPKNGALHPVSPRKIVRELSQKYDIVFVHQNNNYRNWIGVINENNYSSIYWDIRDEQPNSIASHISGKINSVQQVGNTISLITDDNIYYLFYHNEKYTYLGEIPQVPVINMGTSTEMAHAQFYFTDEYKSGTVTPDNFIDSTKGLVNKAMDALVNGWTDKDGTWHDGFGLMLFDACFIRYAYRLYDGTLTKHSPPILVMPAKNILETKTIQYMFYDGKLVDNFSKIDVYGHRIYMHYDFTQFDNGNIEKWKDIIKSVDIFLSPPLGISNIENIRKDLTTKDGVRVDNTPLIKELTPEILKNVANASTFYLIRSVNLGTSSPGDGDPLPTKDKTDDISRLENLIFQEVMSDDNFSNHKYGAEVSYAYNSRLHLGNIKTTFFRGFNASYFQWLTNYNGVEGVPGQVSSLCIEVEIQVGPNVEKVYSFYTQYVWAPKLFAGAFVSYPDPRAKRLTIYEVSRENTGDYVWTRVFTTQLEPHNLLNIAFYLNDGLKPIVGIDDPKVLNTPPVNTNKSITLLESNKIKVSELSNPLNFPNTNTYQTGTGNILALATNAMNVSDRNYGQYPLYVFTTQGIWTLNVGTGEVVYSTQTAPTYTEAPTTAIVGETPYGVAFTTQRGLLIINGQSVDFISPQIEQTPQILNIETNSHCDGVVFSPEQKKFAELLKRLSDLIYNPYENELIINVKESELNYILSFNNQSFYQSTEKISLRVGNVFPELFVVNDTTLKDYASAESPLTHISFITRPLRYGMPDIKKFERIILRALLYNVTKPAQDKFSLFMVHYSMDGVNFKALTGFPIKEGNNKDLDANLMSRSKFSNAMFTLSGIVDEQTEIYYLDTEFEKEYNNSKMR